MAENKETISYSKASEIETAIAKLVLVSEIQTKQTDRILKTIENFAYVNLTVEQNTADIGKLGVKVAEAFEVIHVEEAKMSGRIDRQRKELDNIGQGRLWKGLSIALGTMAVIFGYFYTDMHRLMDDTTEAMMVQREIRRDIQHVQGKMDSFEIMQREHLKEVRLRRINNGK